MDLCAEHLRADDVYRLMGRERRRGGRTRHREKERDKGKGAPNAGKKRREKGS
jgi:hypothetical protein